MNRSISLVAAFALAILFFIQLAGSLVEAIYVLDLMNLALDEKALGVLFFFVPVLLFPLFKNHARQTAWVMCAVLLAARGLLPHLDTADRLLAAGLGTVAALTLLFLLLTTRPGTGSAGQTGLSAAAGLGLALLLSACLRAWGHGLDYSLTRAGGWAGWVLAILLVAAVALLEWHAPSTARKERTNVTAAVMGILSLLTLAWFSFSAPSVIARWTQGNYTLILGSVSLLAAAGTWMCIARPKLLDRLSGRLLLGWNLLFTMSLAATLLSQQVAFPATPESAAVVIGQPVPWSRLALVLLILAFPVLLFDMRLFAGRIAQSSPTPRELVPGFLWGMLFMVALVFVNIFSNVWAYVPPVSPWFRGTFWLAFFLLAGAITLLAWLTPGTQEGGGAEAPASSSWGWAVVLGILFVGTMVQAWPKEPGQPEPAERTSLLVMTYNIQQANDDNAQKSYERQLALMREVSPDLISLQESDSTRISLNNNDYVRYFADRLGYYSYFGPTTVTGTYGTALLSRYPLENTRTVFTYSDSDEIGTTEAEIEVNGRRMTIYNVHPAGSDPVMLVFANTLLERSRDKPNVIALGDYNLRDDEEAYRLIDSVYANAWTSVYPSEVSPDGVDMSGDNRIDHIFVSPHLGIRNPVYVLPPDSATDHPVHWAEVYWEAP